jgi:hypothetical protein
VLDFVNPLRADGRLRRSGRNARLDDAWPLRRPAGTPQHAPKMASRGKGATRLCRPANIMKRPPFPAALSLPSKRDYYRSAFPPKGAVSVVAPYPPDTPHGDRGRSHPPDKIDSEVPKARRLFRGNNTKIARRCNLATGNIGNVGPGCSSAPLHAGQALLSTTLALIVLAGGAADAAAA